MASAPTLIVEQAEISKLRLGDGDVVVVRCGSRLRDEARAIIGDVLADIFPKNRAIILDSNMTLFVVGPDCVVEETRLFNATELEERCRDVMPSMTKAIRCTLKFGHVGHHLGPNDETWIIKPEPFA